jgi:uncharacterized protein (DUF2141 family)
MKSRAMGMIFATWPSLALAADVPPATATLTIKVRHIIDAGGDLQIGIYEKANYATKGGMPVARKSAHARGPTMSFTFDGIPPGTYAAKVLQDVNQNGNFDFGPKGMEPFGFSNDPVVTVGLPPFDEAKFTVTGGTNTIEITLR